MAEADFVSTLDEETLKKAKDELMEDPKERMSAIRTFREWILSQNYLKGPTDNLTLLAFLRGNKFSQLLAREMYERYLTVKTKWPEWMDDVDTHEPSISKIIDEGVMYQLPGRDKEGRVIIFNKPGAMSASRKDITFRDQVHADLADMCTLIFDETTMVNGIVLFIDMTDITMKHLTKDVDNIRKWSQVWEGHFPGRFKQVNFYNTGPVFEAMNAVIRPFMSKKMQDRMRVHTTMESVYRTIPMECLPEEYLPDDYTGPNAGTIKDCTTKFKNMILAPETRRRLLAFTDKSHKIDLTRKPGSQVPQASFRKLNVD